MFSIDYKSVDWELIDKNNLKFPRFYKDIDSKDIVLFFTETEGALLKSGESGESGYKLEDKSLKPNRCTNEGIWQPIDVILSNTSVNSGQELVEVEVKNGLETYHILGIILNEREIMVLIPENDPCIKSLTDPEFKGTWTYVKISISHTNGITKIENLKPDSIFR